MSILNRTFVAASLAIAMQVHAQPQAQTHAPAQQVITRNLVAGICWPRIEWTTAVEQEFNRQRDLCIAQLLKACWPDYKGSTGAESYANEWVKACYQEAQNK